MAIQDLNGRIHGRAGTMVYRRWRGLNILQSRPKVFKQTIATKAAAIEFGKASNNASNIRKTLARFYQQSDLGMNNRLTKQVLKCLQHSEGKERMERDIHDADLSYLTNFQFNTNSYLTDTLPVIPHTEVSKEGKASVHIPAFAKKDIKYTGEAKWISHYRLRIVAIAYDFRNEFCEIVAIKEIDIEEEQQNIDWQLEEEVPAGMILLIGVALYAEQRIANDCVLLNSQAWSPAAIVGIAHVTEGEKQEKTAVEKLQKEAELGRKHKVYPVVKARIWIDTPKFREAYKEWLAKKAQRQHRSGQGNTMVVGKLTFS